MKPLQPNGLQQASYVFREWYVNVDEHDGRSGSATTIADLFNPNFWGRIGKEVNKGDLIRLVKPGVFDFRVVVTQRVPGGLVVGRFPHLPADVAEEIDAAQEAARADDETTRRAYLEGAQ
jgi:hypothetical protein